MMREATAKSKGSSSRKGNTVRETIDRAINLTGKTLVEIADELGYKNSNFLTLLRKGRSRVPMERAEEIAEVLGLDPAVFIMQCLDEYQPEFAKTLRSVFLPDNQMILSKGEMKVVRTMRSTAKGANITPKSRADMDELRQVIRNWPVD